ncbi:MAG: AMP-binding protein [Candidatus Lokiarchaeota archaeon]|nr:AMP-binding protein [Candidatus Lokiarchaeota archaeon]
MKSEKGRITIRTSGNDYETTWLYIPSKISKDPNFPFNDREKVIIELKDNQLLVKKSFSVSDLVKKYGLTDATLPSLIESKANQNKDKPLLYFQNDVFSYQQINQISNQIAHGLLKICKNLDLNRPKIALFFPNCPEAIISWFAVSKIGAISVPINYELNKEQLLFVLNNSDSEILIIDYSYFNIIEDDPEELSKIKRVFIRNAPIGFDFNKKLVDYREILSDKKENPNIKINPSQELEIIYTIGTIGKPKGVIYRNHHTLSGISVGTKLKKVGFDNKEHKLYYPLSLFQAFFHYLVIIPAIYYNNSVIIAEKFDVKTFWDDVNRYEPDGFCYFKAVLLELMSRNPQMSDRKHSLKYAFGFGAFSEIWEAFERRFGIFIIESWSLVENIGLTINAKGSKGGKTGSQGLPARGYELKICDSRGNELPPGRDNIGEIVSRAKLPIKLEYHNLIEESNTKITENRWVYTGDYGYRDSDGFLYYLGRKSDMIKRGGEIFFASNIELVANSHPSVKDSAVVEVHFNGGTETFLKIWCEIKKDGDISYSEFYSYLKENLAYFMVPRFIEFVEKLPKNANYLIQKFILKRQWEERESYPNTFDAELRHMIRE